MLYINSISKEAIESLLTIYNLPAECPQDVTTPLELMDFAFKVCYELIPYRIREHFEIGHNIIYPLIKEDLGLHMLFNAFMVQLFETRGIVKNNGSLFTRISDCLGEAIANDKNVWNLFGDKVDIPRNAKNNFSDIAEYMMLSRSNTNTKYEIPDFLSPLIAYVAVNYDSHKVLKDYKDSQHSSSYLMNNKGISEKLHLNFYDNFKYLLDNFSNIYKVERLFNNSEYSHHTTINRMFFEREYNLGLASKIVVMTLHYPSDIKKQYQKLLSLASLFPNINGRLYYVSSILTGILGVSSDGNTNRSLTSGGTFTLDENLVRIREFARSFIRMALIAVPVMEAYFLYLWKKSKKGFNVEEMKKLMEDYEGKKFIHKKSQPEPFLERTFGFSSYDEWQLAELSFMEIREVLKIINEVKDIQRKSLRTIYLNPYKYLKEHKYDDFSLMISKEEGNIFGIINNVSEIIEEQYSGIVN